MARTGGEPRSANAKIRERRKRDGRQVPRLKPQQKEDPRSNRSGQETLRRGETTQTMADELMAMRRPKASDCCRVRTYALAVRTHASSVFPVSSVPRSCSACDLGSKVFGTAPVRISAVQAGTVRVLVFSRIRAFSFTVQASSVRALFYCQHR